MFDLDGRVALVTGATGGIGGAIAKALHAQGATVLLAGRRQDALDELCALLGGRAHGRGRRPRGEGAADALMKAAEAIGALDILVNNAGITRDTLAMRMKDADWQLVLDTNLTAAFRLSRAALRGMMKRRHGRIVSITSIVGVTGNPGPGQLCRSQGRHDRHEQGAGAEIANRGVTVNCVAPGFIDTADDPGLADAQREALLGRIPVGRLGAG